MGLFSLGEDLPESVLEDFSHLNAQLKAKDAEIARLKADGQHIMDGWVTTKIEVGKLHAECILRERTEINLRADLEFANEGLERFRKHAAEDKAEIERLRAIANKVLDWCEDTNHDILSTFDITDEIWDKVRFSLDG